MPSKAKAQLKDKKAVEKKPESLLKKKPKQIKESLETRLDMALFPELYNDMPGGM